MRPPPIIQSQSRKGRLFACILGIIILCGLSIAAELPFASNQNVGTQLLGMLGAVGYLFALVFSLVFAWIERKHLRLLAVIPLLLCFGSCVATTTVGRSLRRAEFEKQLPRYVALVERIRSVEALASNKVVSISLSEAERDLVYNVLGELDTNGVLTVELLTGGGFPLKHSGYLYTSSGSVEPGSFFDERWPFKTEVKTNWHRISD